MMTRKSYCIDQSSLTPVNMLLLSFIFDQMLINIEEFRVKPHMKIVFQDPTFSFQLLRVIGETYYKGADIGECLSTAYRIKEGD